MKIFFQLVTLLVILVLNDAMELESLYMKTSKLDDQATSGSEFSYSGAAGVPSELYESDSEEASNPLHSSDQGVKSYAKALPPLPYVPEDDVKLVPYSVLEYYKGLENPHEVGYGQRNNYITKFIDDKGNVYSLNDNSHYGFKDNADFDTVRDFDKKLKGKYYNVDDKSFYNEKGGKNGLALQKDGHYASQHGYGNVQNGGSFSQKNGHRKGARTSGYQKVYRKNDYNKQHKFYDIADRRGHFKKYGNRHAKEGSASGYLVRDNNKDQQYTEKELGAKGVSDKGSLDQYLNNFKAAKGTDGFMKEYSNYDKENGSENKEIYDATGYK